MHPAIVLLEFDSIAVGIEAGDSMAKRAPLQSLHAGSVQPGKYIILAGGEVGDVEEARTAGRDKGSRALVGEIYLPEVHADVVTALTGGRRPVVGDALGIIETRTVAATIGASDAGVKGATVTLLEIHMADGLGGKGYALFSGDLADVEAAVEVGVSTLPHPELLVARVVIPRLHPEMLSNLVDHPEFGPRARSYKDKG